MEFELKDLLSNHKPSFVTEEEWKNYVESGRRKEFYVFNFEKTAITTALIASSITLIVQGLYDLLLLPPPLKPIDFKTMMFGFILLLFAMVVNYMYDRGEELRNFRREKEHIALQSEIKKCIDEEVLERLQQRKEKDSD